MSERVTWNAPVGGAGRVGVHVCVCAMRTAGITYWTFGGRLTRRMKEPWATARPTRSTTKVRSLPILLTPSKYVFFLENLFFFRSFVELVFLETYFLSIGVLFVQEYKYRGALALSCVCWRGGKGVGISITFGRRWAPWRGCACERGRRERVTMTRRLVACPRKTLRRATRYTMSRLSVRHSPQRSLAYAP